MGHVLLLFSKRPHSVLVLVFQVGRCSVRETDKWMPDVDYSK